MSGLPLALGRPRPARSKRKRKAKPSRAAVSTEYSLLLTATLCLLAFGAVMVFSASSTTQVLANGGLADSAYYLQRTLIVGAIGLVIMHFTARHGLVAIRRATPVLLAASIFLLVVVLGAGQSVNGATRWIGGGSFQIQPSELAKVALVLYAADMLAREPKRVRSIQGFMPILLMTGAACLLIMLEPDMGTTLVVAFAVAATLIAAGAAPRDLGKIALGIGVCLLLLTIVEPYRMARLTSFLHPGSDTEGAGFQAAQAKIALGSGGLFGVGIGNGVMKAYYLPEAHTDMISAVIGEELGLVGILGVVGLFGMFGFAGLRIAQKAKDNYGKILVAGLTSMVLVTAMINLFAVMGLAPLTGVPLPFISYGNSALLSCLFAVGVILNVARGGTASGARATGRRGSSNGSRKLRVVEGGRSPARERSGSSGARRAKSGGGGGGNRGARGARHGGRRRAT
ncbi:MAG TPA: putative lipid II flippase FtsW [Solirubrobacterales bacterium]|nr:putative lipid II flippase FtsW [Solirubrobacterales bacterium]